MEFTEDPKKQEHDESGVHNESGEHREKGAREKKLERIAYLKSLPQPAQRTREWYELRHNLITASNAWKAIADTQAPKNALIYEKCQPIPEYAPETASAATAATAKSAVTAASTLGARHWGQKYEPLTLKLYEHQNRCRAEEFGCIRHDQYSFLGASPDGIVVAAEDPALIGRMIEIKNVVSREITGVPKKEYWVQMQMQMEVCDIDECDFVETKFTEFDSAAAFWSSGAETSSAPLDKMPAGIRKGVVAQFCCARTGAAHYEYMPLGRPVSRDEVEAWCAETVDALLTTNEYLFVAFLYWKLERYSCVYVRRDRAWFAAQLPKFRDLWATVERERVEGYAHRAPKKRAAPAVVAATTTLLDDFFAAHEYKDTEPITKVVRLSGSDRPRHRPMDNSVCYLDFQQLS